MDSRIKAWAICCSVALVAFGAITILGSYKPGNQNKEQKLPESFIYTMQPYGQQIAVVFCDQDKCDVRPVPGDSQYQVANMLKNAPDSWGGLYQNNIIILKDVSLGSVVHESYHATNDILKKVGVKYSAQTEEVYAYTIQHLVSAISLQ
jgi:hypothetical protein